MWLRGILQARNVAPAATADAEAPAEVSPGTPVSSPVVSAAVPRGYRLSPIADDDATQRSAGVPDVPEEEGDDDDANPTISRHLDLPAPEPADLPQPGAIVGGTYQVVSELGRGSMGVVLAAFDQKLERTVAIKLIRAELLDSGFRRRFMDEARVMAQINHPNVVCIHAFGEHNSMPYFVMELVEGTNLEQWQRRNQGLPDIALAVKILNDVCLGVSAIHAAGAVHRDIKPSNILLDAQLRSRVADFGVSARALGADGAEVVGTPGYIPPEVVLSPDKQKNPDARSDVYSLGCIAYEVLTGAHPFKRKGEPLWTVVPPEQGRIPLASSIRQDLPAAFDRVLSHALEWDLEKRTPSVEAFRRGLLDAMQSDGTPERIVVAEDDEEFRDLIEERLRKEFPGVDLECVGNGLAALDAVARKPTSVALIDLQMPELDGVALTARLRNREDLSGMPIIVLTASGGAREWQRLSTLGADRFLVKPVQLDDVVTFIRQALRERGRRPPSTRAPSPVPER
jgi:serine/threonine-protein kinase